MLDILKVGEKKLKLSSLQTFNSKIQVVIQGSNGDGSISILEEHDNLAQPDFEKVEHDSEVDWYNVE